MVIHRTSASEKELEGRKERKGNMRKEAMKEEEKGKAQKEEEKGKARE